MYKTANKDSEVNKVTVKYHHAVKTYPANGDIAPRIHNFDITWREVSFTPRALYTGTH